MKDLKKEDLIHEVDGLLNNITTARRLRDYSMEVEAKEMFYRWIMKRKILDERKKTLEEVRNKIFIKRGCRSHEPENCNICEERQNILNIVDELSKITKRGK